MSCDEAHTRCAAEVQHWVGEACPDHAQQSEGTYVDLCCAERRSHSPYLGESALHHSRRRYGYLPESNEAWECETVWE